ncbi:MAG: helix-hairpin-helix domain-containing protein, partial [Acidimicrobiales bacterium]
TTAPGTPATGPPAMATVHAAGAVVSPGIYAVPSGARIADVLLAAGGALPEADLGRLNLAARVADGDRVYVLRKGEAAEAGAEATAGSASPAAAGTAPAGPLDLNTATAEQLDTLPGVGPATAQAIITYRTRHGRFRSVTELLEVPGIGPAKLESVRSLVKV